MPYFKSQHDNIDIYYQIYQPSSYNLTLVFSHGWPMSSRMFEHMVLQLADTYRCVVYDRRGFGKSDWGSASWTIFADDLTKLIELTCPSIFVGIGASMGCDEFLSVINTNNKIAQRCKGFVWLGPALPVTLASEVYPTAPSQESWDAIIKGLRYNRHDFIRSALPSVFGRELTATELMRFENIIDQADSVAFEQCIKILIQQDFTEDLKKLDKPTLVIWGKEDTIPIEAGALAIKNLAPHVELKVYEDAAHGVYQTHAEQCLKDIKAFIGRHFE